MSYSQRRRSSRIQRNVSSNRNGTIINGTGSSPHNNTNSNRSLSINNNNTNRNGNRYSGRKRRKPESDNESSSNSDSTHNDSDHENNNISNHNNKRRRLNNTHSQQSELATQTQTTQTRNRLKISYKLQKGKWNVTPTNKLNIKRRSTRIKYRQLADDTIDNRAAIVDPMNKDFINKLVTQNNIYNNVIHPNEAYMDIEQAKTMTTILKEQTHTLANEHFTITPHDYIKSIYKEFTINNNNNNNNSDDDSDDDDEPKRINWSAVGQRFAPWFLTVPCIQFMNGPLQQSIVNQPEEKKKRQTRKKQTFKSDAPVIQPKKVVKQKKSDKTETKSRVQHLRKVLKKKCSNVNSGKGVNPFAFLINPDSYSQTIENLFDLSFIMKEGDAQMNVNNVTKQPELTYISKAENTRRLNINKQKKSNKKNKANNGQCIVKFNPKDYYHLIKIYQIEESQIERADANMDSDEDNDDDDTEVSEENLDTDSDSDNDGNNDRAMNGNNDKEEAE